MTDFRTQTLIFILVMSLLSLFACEDDEKHVPNTLTASVSKVDFEKDGGVNTISIETDAESWSITNPASSWLNLSRNTGTEKTAMVTLIVNSKTPTKRTDTLTITAGDATPVKIIVSQQASEFIYYLQSNLSSINFKRAGNQVDLKITTNAPQWNISSDADWVTFDKTTGTTTGTNTEIYVKISSAKNLASESRTAKISLTAQYAPSIEIDVKQNGELYPSYNTSPTTPDATGMGSTATEIAAKMTIGWNIGNTLEAIGGETAWGNPKVTDALIKLVKQNGFNSIRIPCSWDKYLENNLTAKIKPEWLDRVKQVVQHCVDNDMYVILNIHWDGGWLENNCTPEKQDENNAKQKAFWEQIATHLRDFDEHLIFAGTNEPNVENATQMTVLSSYLQTFVDAVRATGGKNAYRVLVVQGPSTDIEKTNKLMNTLPTDQIPNKMMVEVHYYTPYQFCLMENDASWGKMFYYWGNGYHSTTDSERNSTWGEEATVDQMFGLMKTKFVDKGIPVILGEYAVVRRTTLTGENFDLHLASRAYYLKYVTKQAKANGMIPFYWDAGGMDDLGSALFNRPVNSVFDQQALDAIIEGANQ